MRITLSGAVRAVVVAVPAFFGGPAAAQGGGVTAIVPFEASAFPYRGAIPDQGVPFLDFQVDGRPGHTSPRGGRYFEDATYSSRDVLISVPKGIDWARPVTLVVYFHGNEARLGRDVRDRQRVPAQVAASGLNAVLVAPQMAVDALDSSAGNFWTAGFFARFVEEAGRRTTELAGDGRAAAALARAPIVIVAYSGGYLPTAFSLEGGGAGERVRGVILLDGLYAEEQRIADWIGRRGRAFFFSAHSPSTRAPNEALRRLLVERGVPVTSGLPETFAPGAVAFTATSASVAHDDFVTRAWVPDPLRAVLSRLREPR